MKFLENLEQMLDTFFQQLFVKTSIKISMGSFIGYFREITKEYKGKIWGNITKILQKLRKF